jgi:NADH-quinone oxidoreductase subunit N
MTAADWLGLSPWIVLAAAAVLVMLAIAFHRSHRLTAVLSALGLALALASIPFAAATAPRTVTPLFAVDGFSLFFTALILLAALAVVALSYDYLAGLDTRGEAFYLLVLIATLGAAVLAGSIHYASLLLGLETLSVALFALTAYPVLRERPLEAGVKYLILAGVSAAVLLFGIALLYASTGALDFNALRGAITETPLDIYLAAGLMLVVVGLAFKLSLVPFHLWTPDVYEGAPPPVTTFLATVSKGAVLALLLRYLLATDAYGLTRAMDGLVLVGIVTMLAGNLLALRQPNVKRLLAYSSMSHMGYLVVPLVAGGELALETAGYYLAAYFLMNLAAFGAVTLLEAEGATASHDLADYRGLLWRRPWLASVLAVSLFALAGMPLTVGFVAKFYLFTAGIDGGLWLLLAALIAGSVLGLFYYLRVIVYLIGAPAPAPAPANTSWPGHATLAAVLVLLILFGVYPAPLIAWVRASVAAVLP